MLTYLSYAAEGILLANFILLFFIAGKKKPHRILQAYLLFVLTIQVYSHWLRNMGQNNLFLSHILFPGQCLLLNAFCYISIKAKKVKRLLAVTFALATAIGTGIFLLSSKVYAFNNVEILVTNIAVIGALLAYLYDSIDSDRTFRITAIGLLIYFMGSTVVFLSGNLLVNVAVPTKGIWILHSILFSLSQVIIMADNIKQLKRIKWEALKQKSFPQ